MKPKARMAIAPALALALAVSLAQPALAVETMERTYAPGQTVEQTIVDGGATWDLSSTHEVAGAKKREERDFSDVRTKTVTAREYKGNPRSHFEGSIQASEDGFAGSVQLSDARVVSTGTHTDTVTSTRTDTIETSDANLEVPKKKKFDVSGQELEFDLAEEKREPVENGRWRVTATYNREDVSQVTDSYLLEATYSGKIYRDAQDPSSTRATYTKREEQAPQTAAPAASSSTAPQAAGHSPATPSSSSTQSASGTASQGESEGAGEAHSGQPASPISAGNAVLGGIVLAAVTAGAAAYLLLKRRDERKDAEEKAKAEAPEPLPEPAGEAAEAEDGPSPDSGAEPAPKGWEGMDADQPTTVMEPVPESAKVKEYRAPSKKGFFGRRG